jgi:hypothetical protein
LSFYQLNIKIAEGSLMGPPTSECKTVSKKMKFYNLLSSPVPYRVQYPVGPIIVIHVSRYPWVSDVRHQSPPLSAMVSSGRVSARRVVGKNPYPKYFQG